VNANAEGVGSGAPRGDLDGFEEGAEGLAGLRAAPADRGVGEAVEDGSGVRQASGTPG